MKYFKYILLSAVLIAGLSSCNDLELEPKGILDEGTLFNSDYGVKKYFAGIYNELPIEDFNYKAAGDGKGYSVDRQSGQHTGNVWEAQKGYAGTVSGETAGRGNDDMSGAWGYWPYGRIRDINVFISNFPEYRDNFTESKYNELLGEGYFLRAYYYFAMAKRYGGVPIVDVAQDPTLPLDSLQLPRNTEYETWKFIYSDLKFAMENMSTDRSSTGRANRYAAAALMSKAMLYAGCVAKYGSYVGISGEAVNAGLMGMDASYAEEFFQYAYDACKMISQAGFTLHRGADKEKAYTEVFIENCASDEDIFVKNFGPKATTPSNMSLTHCWDTMVLPKGTGMANDVGSAIHALWDLVSLYEVPAVTDENGNPVRFDSLSDFWNNEQIEPRCRANFFFSGMTESVSGSVLDIQAGVYTSYPGTAADGTPEGTENDYTKKYRIRAGNPGTTTNIEGYGAVKINGNNGYAEGTGDEGYSTTGIFIRKYVNYSADASTRVLFGSSQSYKVFRYGEILCNWAEAAYELGLIKGDESLKQEAFEHINELRDRAGAHAHAMVASPEDIGSTLYGFPVDENLQYIRDERRRELCLENQSNWDIRRWRIAHASYDNYWPRVLFGYKVLNEDKYIYLNEREVFGRKLTFDKKYYYEPIPDGEINKNPRLIRNDGY